ncbi:Pentatricopeptide repeat-containing protein [Nymphaea thermarum]|nr:Pentatricopeptide repeat-containing protein [Nymphaea thermarum]
MIKCILPARGFGRHLLSTCSDTLAQCTGGCLGFTCFTPSVIKVWVRICTGSSQSGPLEPSNEQGQVAEIWPHSLEDFGAVRGLHTHHMQHSDASLEDSSAFTKSSISWAGSTYSMLLNNLETTLKDHRIIDAWESFTDFKRLYGYPTKCLLQKLLAELSYSSEPAWLRKAYDLVLVIKEEKPEMLCYDTLIMLTLTLSRAEMPIPASSILRLLLEKAAFPPVGIWTAVFVHLVKSKIGTCLASELLIEISECFLKHKRNLKKGQSSFLKSVTPNTGVFNLVLNACLKAGSVLKAQEIIELMAQTGVGADLTSIAIMSLVHERNGQRDELKKLEAHVSEVSAYSLHHYQLLYNSLLSLHFKFRDIDASLGLVVNLYKRQQGCAFSNEKKGEVKEKFNSSLVNIGSRRLRTSLTLKIEPRLLENNFVIEIEGHPDLVILNKGKLIPSHKALAKFIIGCTRVRKTEKLAKLFSSIQKELDEAEVGRMVTEVIKACVHLGWFETAHDIIEDLNAEGVHIEEHSYSSLLIAYCKRNQFKEAVVLITQMRKVGLLRGMSNEQILSDACGTATRAFGCAENSELAEHLEHEFGNEDSTHVLVLEINAAISFFCTAKMIEDAQKSFRKMKSMSLQPTVQTFGYLVNAYSSLGMHREVTMMWGEIKECMVSGVLKRNRDLHDSLLLNFLRGGYFERAMEVIGLMSEHGMFIDKLKYRREFLKLHGTLYRGLRISDAKNEVQRKRLEHVRAFRRWAEIK